MVAQQHDRQRRSPSPGGGLKQSGTPLANPGGTFIGFPTSPVRQASPKKAQRSVPASVPSAVKYCFNAMEEELLAAVQQAADPSGTGKVTYSTLVLAFGKVGVLTTSFRA